MQLELYCVKDVMSSPVETIHQVESVQHLSRLLLETSHGGFPVVKKSSSGHVVFIGLITRYGELFCNRETQRSKELEWKHRAANY